VVIHAEGSGPVLESSDTDREGVASDGPEPFDEFFMREYARVLAVATALTGSRWAAEDLTQEAFLVAHADWDRLSRYDHPGAWVRRVVANKAVSTFRRRQAEARAFTRWWLLDRGEVPDLTRTDADFWRAVRSLSRRQAQVIVLYYLEDLSVDDIADVLDVAPGTVKRHLHRGREALARAIEVMPEEGS
jgi:RNA polymerase sigma-70 factor (ECF subfamily)